MAGCLEQGGLDAVVLAGGTNHIQLHDHYRPGCKALLEFAGRPSVRYLLEALGAVPQVRRIALVGNGADLRPVVGEGEYEFVEGEKTLGGNILRGLRHFAESRAVLFVTADAPLITRSCIADFLTACQLKGGMEAGDVFLSFAPQDSFTGRFRGQEKARLFFRDGIFCHGNLGLADPRVATRLGLAERIDRIYQVRKETVKTILSFGWTIAATYVIGAWLLRRLTMEQMAAIASRRLGLRLVPLVIDRPEIVIDVDEPEDYLFVRAFLEEDLSRR